MVVQEVFQKTQEPWRWGVQWPAVGSWQQPIERIINADPLKTTWKVAQELSIDRSLVIWHWKQIGKVKKLDKWVPSQQTKKMILKCHFFCATTKNHFFFLDCDAWLKVGFIWQPAITSPVVGPRRGSKALPKAKLTPEKVMVTVCPSATSLIHYSFLNTPETILRRMLSKLMREALKSAKLQAGIGEHKGPNSSPWQRPTTCLKTNASEVEWIELRSFASSVAFI